MVGNNDRWLLFKQYLRWLPAQLGLFNKGAFLLQIDRIDPGDTFIASYPKSGNTWIRFVIANLMCSGEELNFGNIDQYVPDVYSAKNILNAKPGSRFIKTHANLLDWYPKVIYIYRDYRDVLVSFYHYATARGNFEGSLEEFITRYIVLQPHGAWKTHVKAALDFKHAHPDRMLLLSYEQLLQNPGLYIRQLADFCNIKPFLSIAEILERTDFQYLKSQEQKYGSEFNTPGSRNFFRSGMSGEWKNVFSESMKKVLQTDTELVLLMQELGYTF